LQKTSLQGNDGIAENGKFFARWIRVMFNFSIVTAGGEFDLLAFF
jgi:hypothetical protein